MLAQHTSFPNIAVYDYFLFLLARCSRYFAFCRAEPLPWAPVMYFFFFALVLTLPSSSFLFDAPPRPHEMPLAMIASISSPLLISFFIGYSNCLSGEKSQHLNTSTSQHLNISTYQHLNVSTHQHLNLSPLQPIRLMMEEAHTCERHCDAILVAGINNIVVANRTACLSDVLYAALVRTLDVVAEREERV